MRKKHRVLHHWMLVAIGACYLQRKSFVSIFGYKATINKKNLLKAHENGLDIFYFMRVVLSGENRCMIHRISDELFIKMKEQYGIESHEGWQFYREQLIDKWLPMFESQTEFWWSENPFGDA